AHVEDAAVLALVEVVVHERLHVARLEGVQIEHAVDGKFTHPLRAGVPALEVLLQDATSESLRTTDRFFPCPAAHQDAGKLGDLGDPGAILFALDFDVKHQNLDIVSFTSARFHAAWNCASILFASSILPCVCSACASPKSDQPLLG